MHQGGVVPGYDPAVPQLNRRTAINTVVSFILFLRFLCRPPCRSDHQALFRANIEVLEKEINHHSSIYGKIVDANGRTIVADADIDMKVPRGGKFVPAPMRYFMRFHEADGMHAGYLPGYPASHGCVRMPEQLAIAFYHAVDVGTPVTVFGRTPRTRGARRPRPAQHPRSAPRAVLSPLTG